MTEREYLEQWRRSGRELRAVGYPQDVEHWAQINAYETVPRMVDDWLVADE